MKLFDEYIECNRKLSYCDKLIDALAQGKVIQAVLTVKPEEEEVENDRYSDALSFISGAVYGFNKPKRDRQHHFLTINQEDIRMILALYRRDIVEDLLKLQNKIKEAI